MKLHKILSLLSIAMLSNYAMAIIGDGATFQCPGPGETADISTASDLAFMMENCKNTTGATFKLVNDIDLSGRTLTRLRFFSGTFDGQYHTISNFTSRDGGGMFDMLYQNAIVKNLKLKNVYMFVDGSNQMSGVVANTADDNAIISKVAVSGKIDIDGSGIAVGGLVGAQVRNTKIMQSSFSGDVFSGQKNVIFGGLLGATGRASIDSEITDSYATGNVTGIASASGGLIGTDDEQSGKLNNSYSTMKLSLAGSKGGLEGVGSLECKDSYWDVNVTLTNKSAACPTGGRTTAQMQTASTYQGWDTNIWKITNGAYPKLLWEAQNNSPEK
ncbi:MAG: surface protein containing Ig-like domain-like [Burkholderiales bacterium]|jgi:hypothetical protein|nr:surface protein containing Ig-like domain-like [Burkholderiales bacterium]